MKSDEVRKKCGSANKGKTFSPERRKRMSDGKRKSSYKRPPITEEQRLRMGRASAARYTTEYKKRQREIMVSCGAWVAEEKKSDYSVYFKEADWVARMWDQNIPGSDLIAEVGIFNARKNPQGLVRDHMFSRRHGFDAGVFPEILRHPTNCSIVPMRSNVQKRDHSSLSIEELFARIRGYCGDWPEHATCLRLINSYEEGARWERKKIDTNLDD